MKYRVYICREYYQYGHVDVEAESDAAAAEAVGNTVAGRNEPEGVTWDDMPTEPSDITVDDVEEVK